MGDIKRKIQDINIPRPERGGALDGSGRVVSHIPKGGVIKPRVPSSVSGKVVRKSYEQDNSPRKLRKISSRSPVIGPEKLNNHEHSSKFIWIVAIILVFVLGYLLSLRLSTASVMVSLKERVEEVDTTLVLFRDSVENQLDYDTVVFSETFSKLIDNVTTEKVEERASGKVVIYNNYSTSPQRLLEETRFEDSKGRIYKLAKGGGLSVPGFTIVDGEKVPGSIEAIIYADLPGVEYNQAPTDFVIPGFRGGPKFDGFYARSLEPLEGGFSGERPNIDEESMKSSLEEAKNELLAQLDERVSYQIPNGYIILPDGVSYEWLEPEYRLLESGSVEVTQTANISLILVKETELISGLLDSTMLSADDKARTTVVNLGELDFVSEVNDISSEVSITVSGDARVRWVLPEDSFVMALVGMPKKGVPIIMSRFPELQSAQVKISPPWILRLPKKSEKIEVYYQNGIDRQ